MCPVTGSTVIILAEMEDTMSDFAGGLPGCLAEVVESSGVESPLLQQRTG